MTSESISRYRLLGLLGRGGMGEVHLAEDTDLGRKVAIKRLPEERRHDDVARKRLLHEARSAAALDHPYICGIHEVGSEEGTDFIVMEYVEGETLQQRLTRGPLAQDEALRIAGEVAEALAEAHRKGIVHRDLKPANVMLSRKGHVKVMDFGLARQVTVAGGGSDADRTATALTQTGMVPGTLAYMSPEQLKGEAIDGRSDIFALGILLYEAMAGAHPFQRPTPMETAAAILQATPAPLAGRVADLPEPIDRLVSKALAKEPDARHQSAAELGSELTGLRASLQSGSGAAPRPARVTRPAWPRLATAAAVIAAVAVAWWGVSRSLRMPASALAFNERDWIVIADFDNRTGDPVFDRTLETAMAVSIQQSKWVNVFPRGRVQQTLARMQKPETSRLDAGLAREVAQRENVKAVLACAITRVGDEYVLTAELVDPATQVAVASEAARARGRDQVLAALDDLAKRTRERLGESLASIARQKVGLPRATTSSLEALKALAESQRSKGPAVAQLLEQAIALDPEFAMAHADLGVYYSIANNRAAGEEHFKKALALLDRLTVRERLWIAAVVEDWRGNRDQGIENYRTYLSQYPDDMRGWFRLGYASMITQRLEPAVDAFEQVLRLAPAESGAWVNLATCYNTMRQNEKALESYTRAFDLDRSLVTGTFVNSEYGFMLARTGQVDRARQTFELMLATDSLEKKARGHRSLALLAAYRGRYGEAVREFTEAVALDLSGKAQLSELRDRLYLAAALHSRGAVVEGDRELDAATRVLSSFKAGVFWLALTGKALARRGRMVEAERLLALATERLGELGVTAEVNQSARTDRAAASALAGEIALARKRYGEAVRAFEEAERLAEKSAAESLAKAEHERGNLDRAVVWYERLVASDALGTEAQEPWILAHYQLGRIWEEKADVRKAAGYYERFLAIWNEADPRLPPVEDARQRLARLKTGPA